VALIISDNLYLVAWVFSIYFISLFLIKLYGMNILYSHIFGKITMEEIDKDNLKKTNRVDGYENNQKHRLNLLTK